MNILRCFFRISAVCAGLFALTVIVGLSISSASHYAPLSLQAAQQAAARCTFRHWPGTKGVWTAGTNIVCFYGPVTVDSSKKFLSLPIKEGSTVVLESLGGDANAALDMADVIQAKHLVSVVESFCVSACANYLFTAASAKFVLPGGVVGFHGVPDFNWTLNYNGPPEFRATGLSIFQRYMRDLVDRQARFYAGIGVNIALASDYPLSVPLAEFNRVHGMWEYGPETLRNKFGVQNILFFQTPDQYGFVTRALSHLSAYHCKPDKPDVYFCA